VRIFIASSNRTLRSAVQLLVDGEPGMVVTGIADRAESLLTLVGASQPDALLLDNELTKQVSGNLISALHHLEAAPKIVVFSTDPHVKATTLASGADAFISMNIPPDDLLPILRGMRLSATIR